MQISHFPGAGSESEMEASSLMLKPSIPAPHHILVCSIAGKTEILGDKHVTTEFCSTKMPHGLPGE